MRYFIFAFTFLLLVAQHSFAQEKMFYGNWKMLSIDGRDPSGRDGEIRLVFMKKGAFELVDAGRSMKGVWKLSEDNKMISIEIPDEDELESITVVEVGKKTMKLDNRGSIATFEKIGKAPKAKKPKKIKGAAKKLAATWQITTVNGMNLEGDDLPVTIIQLNEDGSAWSSIIGEGGEIGTWKLTNEDKKIVINFNGEEKPANFTLSDNDNVLELSDNGAVIRMKRIESKIEKPKPYEEPWEDPIEPVDNPLDDPSIIVGEWTVVAIDEDVLEERDLVFSIKADKTFSVSDNGELEREGTWEIKKNKFYIKDTKGYSSDYMVTPGVSGVLFLQDYYGKMKLEKK